MKRANVAVFFATMMLVGCMYLFDTTPPSSSSASTVHAPPTSDQLAAENRNTLNSDVVADASSSSKMTDFRFERVIGEPSDRDFRVPSIPMNLSGLVSVEWRKTGLFAFFSHISPPTADRLPKAPSTPGRVRPVESVAPLKIAVEMSGHMRTYRACYKSTVDRVLAPNQALLFAVTYPDVGDKRFGIRVQEPDLPVHADELAVMYRPYLASLALLDVPIVRQQLETWFPTVVRLPMWTWMLYQLFTMELTHNMTLRYMSVATAEASRLDVDPGLRATKDVVLLPSSQRSAWGPSFDVVIRVRPDLYIIGSVFVRPTNEARTEAGFFFDCDGQSYPPKVFSVREVIRSSHHPTVEYFSDPISDHSAVGFTASITSLLSLFSKVRWATPEEQQAVFKVGNSAEKMWVKHINDTGMTGIRAFGWHIMLRNKEKYFNSTEKAAKGRRRGAITKKVFGVTDPSEVTCPRRDGSMERLTFSGGSRRGAPKK